MTLPALPSKVPPEVPLGSKVLCVGEAPGKQEALFLRPFVGGSGQLLRWTLKQAGLENVSFTNVLSFQPPENNINFFSISRGDLRSHACPDWYRAFPNSTPGKIIHPKLGVPAIEELYELIHALSPSIILALGNTACWALLKQTGIEKLRGAPYWDNPISMANVPSHKIIPTYHPAAVLRNYKLLPVMTLDFIKAKRESEVKGISWPQRWLEIAPTINTIRDWFRAMTSGSDLKLPVTLSGTRLSGYGISCDVETSRNPGPNITLIGFAPRADLGLVIPFINPLSDDGCNFSFADEREIVRVHIKSLLENPGIKKVFHNCLYDLPWIHSYGINPQNAYHDTLIMAHALWPEMRKSLRILGSILTNERNWKFLRTKSNKRED